MPPMSNRMGDFASAGTDVFLEVRFIKVEEVSAALGSMRYDLCPTTYDAG